MRLQHGFTLTEVLVTLLVLNIGLLGVLATQTLALKQVRDAIHRTRALALGNALLQEMQLNQWRAGQSVPELPEKLVMPDATA